MENFDWIQILITIIVSWGLPTLFAAIKPAAAAKLFSKFLSKVIKNTDTLNQVENLIGEEMIKIGKTLKDLHPDEEKPENFDAKKK